MNRRKFFSSLAVLTGAASLSPNIFIPKSEPVRWKVNPIKFTPNPDYENAEYKIHWIGYDGIMTLYGPRFTPNEREVITWQFRDGGFLKLETPA